VLSYPKGLDEEIGFQRIKLDWITWWYSTKTRYNNIMVHLSGPKSIWEDLSSINVSETTNFHLAPFFHPYILCIASPALSIVRWSPSSCGNTLPQTISVLVNTFCMFQSSSLVFFFHICWCAFSAAKYKEWWMCFLLWGNMLFLTKRLNNIFVSWTLFLGCYSSIWEACPSFSVFKC
jgi:hypothetical protein